MLPALARVLNIAGLDPHKWFQDMHRPRPLRALRPRTLPTQALLGALGLAPPPAAPSRTGTGGGGSASGAPQQQLLTSYLLTEHCLLCDARCKDAVCDRCRHSGAAASVALAQLAAVQKQVHAATLLCQRCLHVNDGGAWGGAAPHNARPFKSATARAISSSAAATAATAQGAARRAELPPPLALAGPSGGAVVPWRPMTAAACDSLDCPLLYKRANLREQLASALDLAHDLGLS